MERNLLLFFVIAGSILYFSSTLFPTATPPTPPAKKETAQAQVPTPAPVAPAVKPGTPAPPAIVGAKEEFLEVDTDVHKVRFSTRGGVVTSWQLKKYKDTNGKPLELVQPNGSANPAIGYPMRFAFTDKFPGVEVNQVIFAHRFPTEGFQTIEFEYADANFRGSRSFERRTSWFESRLQAYSYPP